MKHLQAFFALLRRRRLLGRLRAIEAALHLVNGLVTEEETLSHQLDTAIGNANLEPEPSAREAPTEPPQTAESPAEPPEIAPPPAEPSLTDRSPTQQRILSREQERRSGTREPMTPFVSSAEHTRHLLSAFEQQLPDLRRHRVRL